MQRPSPPVFDPAKSPEENVAAGIFRMCEAVEKLGMKLDSIATEVQTLRHAVNAAAAGKKA